MEASAGAPSTAGRRNSSAIATWSARRTRATLRSMPTASPVRAARRNVPRPTPHPISRAGPRAPASRRTASRARSTGAGGRGGDLGGKQVGVAREDLGEGDDVDAVAGAAEEEADDARVAEGETAVDVAVGGEMRVEVEREDGRAADHGPRSAAAEADEVPFDQFAGRPAVLAAADARGVDLEGGGVALRAAEGQAKRSRRTCRTGPLWRGLQGVPPRARAAAMQCSAGACRSVPGGGGVASPTSGSFIQRRS